MRAWLINVGEPLPTDEGGERLLRTGLLADLMHRRGHDVLWWTSSFIHMHKRHRATENTLLSMKDRYQIQLLHGPAYRNNIGIPRLINHQVLASQFRALCESFPPPDLILCSLPLLELCVEATAYGKRHDVPVVLDVRDLWPDVFVDLAPRPFRPLARMALSRYFRQASRSCAAARAITGVTDQMIDWALGHARRQRTANDRAFPFGYQPRRPDDAAFAEARDFWRHHGVSPDHGESIICFFGTLGRHFECETVVAAAKLLQAGGCRARFVLCGGGPDLERWRRLSASCTNVTVPGWVNADRIWALMKMSKLGLAPYVSTWDFMLSIPNKPVEYLAAGLPVLSSLQGVLADLLLRHHCGITYANGSAAELAAAVHDCCEHPQKRDAMSAHAAQLFASRFAAENVYSQMESYLVEQAAAVRVRAA